MSNYIPKLMESTKISVLKENGQLQILNKTDEYLKINELRFYCKLGKEPQNRSTESLKKNKINMCGN